MRYEEALAKHGVDGVAALPPYHRGFIDGLRLYSWMKDGETFVGTTGKLLGDAVDEFLTECRRLGPLDPR